MKKIIFIISFLFSLTAELCALEIPESLYGIWEGKDRLVFFDKNSETGDCELSVCLKTFYGWYIDRTAEPVSYNQINKRSRNDSQSPDSINIITGFENINKNQTFPDAFEIKLQYSKSESNLIPVAVLDNRMYLDFFIQDKEDKSLYRGNIVSKGLMVSAQSIPENISLYYLDEASKKYYDVRYWKTDMDYDDSFVLWTNNEMSFSVDRHLLSAGHNYSSVSGRSKKIRNPVNGFNFDENTFLFSDDKALLVRNKEPYLYKLADHKTLDDLFLIVKEQNSKRKAAGPSPFSYSELEWHKIILELLENNPDMIYEITEWAMDKNTREKMVNGKDF